MLPAELTEGGLRRLWVQGAPFLIHEAVLYSAVVGPSPELYPEAISTVVIPGEGREDGAV